VPVRFGGSVGQEPFQALQEHFVSGKQ
jgi:hypothetical protein